MHREPGSAGHRPRSGDRDGVGPAVEALQHSASRARPGERFAPYWVIAGVLFLYLLPGLIGHDPWKPDEGYVFDIVDHIIRTGHWVIPRLAGQPFMEKPPLYYLVATGFTRMLSPWLPLDDGARCASGLFAALTLLIAAKTINCSPARGRTRN